LPGAFGRGRGFIAAISLSPSLRNQGLPKEDLWSSINRAPAGKWGGLFWATSLEKIFGGVIVDRKQRFRGDDRLITPVGIEPSWSVA